MLLGLVAMAGLGRVGPSLARVLIVLAGEALLGLTLVGGIVGLCVAIWRLVRLDSTVAFANLLAELGEQEAAQRMVDRRVAQRGPSFERASALGGFAMLRQDWPEAEVWLRKALSYRPTHRSTRLNLAATLGHLGLFAEADGVFRALEDEASPQQARRDYETPLMYAQALLDAGRYAEARDRFLLAKDRLGSTAGRERPDRRRARVALDDLADQLQNLGLLKPPSHRFADEL